MQFTSSWIRAAGGIALVAVLSACGGGGSDAVADNPIAAQIRHAVVPVADSALCASGASGYAELDGQCRAVSEVLGITPKIKTTATATITADQFFAWAQTNFAAFFPGSPATTTSTGFVFRAYSSGNAIAVTTSVLSGLPAGTILILGPVTGNALVPLGTLSGFNCTVAPANCTPTNPNPGGGGGNYADCLSTELLKTGNTYQIDLTATAPNGSLSTTNKYTVNGQVAFKGNTATELVIDTTVTASSISVLGVVGTTTRVKNYTALTGSTYSTYGQTIAATVSGFTVDAVTSFTPPLQTPTNLTSGQVYTVSSTMKIETVGIPFPIPAQEFSYSYKFTYVGKESLTVPAGTFQACKVQTTSTSNGTTSNTTQWLVAEGRLKGMPLKTDDGAGTTSVATKLLLNGS